jgi:adenylate kinase
MIWSEVFRMRVVLLGAPGAGKGTQAAQLSQAFNIAQISTGDMLRQRVETGTEIGHRIRVLIDAGELVSDELIIDLIHERVREPDCIDGYIFDGFPRTIPQAKVLWNSDIAVDHILEIAVPDDYVVQRLAGRRVHVASGRVYHTEFNPPLVPDVDDVTSEPLVQRADDVEATIRSRLAIYHAQTRPLVQFYQRLLDDVVDGAPQYNQIDGVGDMGEVHARLAACLK